MFVPREIFEFHLWWYMNVSRFACSFEFLYKSENIRSASSVKTKPCNMEKWEGKVAVVTGASAGIGAAIVQDLAKAGIHVVGLARRSERVEELANNLGETPGKIYAHKCDVSDLESVREAFKWIEQKFGCIAILINNAAILYSGSILDERDDAAEQLNAVISTNFTGAVNCSREAIRLIKKSNDYGLVVNVNSVAGNYVPFGMGVNVYSSTKHALRAFSETLRQELIVSGNKLIRVSNLSPGAVRTEMVLAAGMTTDIDQVYQRIAHLSPENVSQTVMFLLQTPYNVNISQLTIQPVGEKV
jgi:NADP+-dependent farnesol dehydrogenase